MTHAATAKHTRAARCRVRGVPVAIDLGAVRGVERADRMVATDDSGDWPQVGLIPSRTGDTPVFSLAGLLGFPPSATDGSHVLLCEPYVGAAGLLVEQTSQGWDIGPGALVRMPAVIGSLHVPAVVRTESDLLPWLDPVALFGGTPRAFPAAAPWRQRASETAAQRLMLVPLSVPDNGREWAVGLPAACVAEVIEPQGIVLVPGAPRHIAGVVAWRDRVVGVVDLAAWLGLPATAAGLGVIAVATAPGGDEPVGLLVPRGVRMLKLPAPNVASRRVFPGSADRIVSLVETDDQTVVLIDLTALTQGAA